MARRRSGFTKETRAVYNQLKGEGFTQTQIANVMGISRKGLYNWRVGESRIQPATIERIEQRIETDTDRNISINDLSEMVAFYEGKKLNKGQRKANTEAKRLLDVAAAEGITDPEHMVERTTMTTRIGGREVRYRLGRSRDEVMRKAWMKTMRERGYTGDLSRLYDEATGYTKG